MRSILTMAVVATGLMLIAPMQETVEAGWRHRHYNSGYDGYGYGSYTAYRYDGYTYPYGTLGYNNGYYGGQVDAVVSGNYVSTYSPIYTNSSGPVYSGTYSTGYRGVSNYYPGYNGYGYPVYPNSTYRYMSRTPYGYGPYGW